MSETMGGEEIAEKSTARKAPLREIFGRVRALALRDPLRTLVFLIIPLAAAPRLWQMFADQGVFWPDEIFQTIEQAHRLAFGYGWVSWEFRDGARSWLFPGILAGLLKAGSLLGLIKSGVGVVMTTRAVMLGLALASTYGAMRVGERVGGLLGALLAGVMVAFCPPLLVFGTRCMTEMGSAPLLVLAAALVMTGTSKDAAVAGALAGFAIFFRYQNGLFGVAFLLLLLFTRNFKAAGSYALAATLMGVFGGLVDWATWGRPFHSFFLYVRFNLIEGKASMWGVSAKDYYLQVFWRSLGFGLPIVAAGLALSFRRARVLPIVCILNLVVHSAIPHKEYRFVVPMIPLTLALAGGGLGWALGGLLPSVDDCKTRLAKLRARYGGWVGTGLAIAVAVIFAIRTRSITFGEMGTIGGREDGWAPWHSHEGANRALWEAGQHDDICGISIVGVPMVSIGGYSYLHKNVPMLGSMSAGDLAASNYLAVPRLTPPPPGYEFVRSFQFRVKTGRRSDGKKGTLPDYDYVLFRRGGTCTPPPPWWSPNLSRLDIRSETLPEYLAINDATAER